MYNIEWATVWGICGEERRMLFSFGGINVLNAVFP